VWALAGSKRADRPATSLATFVSGTFWLIWVRLPTPTATPPPGPPWVAHCRGDVGGEQDRHWRRERLRGGARLWRRVVDNVGCLLPFTQPPVYMPGLFSIWKVDSLRTASHLDIWISHLSICPSYPPSGKSRARKLPHHSLLTSYSRTSTMERFPSLLGSHRVHMEFWRVI